MQDKGIINITLDSSEIDNFRYIVREETRLCCTHISDVEGDGGTFSEDQDGHDGLFDRLALCSRYAAQLERGETCFEVAEGELSAFRYILCAQMQHDGGELSDMDFYGLTDSPLLIVASQTRIELTNALADQIGGLL